VLGSVRWLRAPTAFLIALLLVACGGDGEDGATDSSRNGESTVAATTPTAEATGSGGVGTPTSGDSNGGEDIDTCTLLTAAEVEAAIGVAVDEGAPNLLNTCDWSSGDPDEISVTVALRGLPTAVLDVCASALASDDQYSEVAALGDGAFGSYNPVMGGLADVVVCTEAGQLQVIVNGGLDDEPNEEQLRGAAEQLAQIVLERL
jgi:hypothetical protein